MKSIFKYDIMENNGIIEGPIIKILHVGVQRDKIKVWAEVDTDAPQRKFSVLPIGTGWDLSASTTAPSILDSHKYLGTIMFADDCDYLVFHVYYAEIKPKSSETKKTSNKTINITTAKKTAQFTTTNAKINPQILKTFIQ